MDRKTKPEDQERLFKRQRLNYLLRIMEARIYKRPKSAMQSGKALVDQWVLDFVPAEAKRPDPLMGWTGSGDTRQQVQLKFPTCEAAQAYADKYGIAARVHSVPPKKLKIQAYADNFR